MDERKSRREQRLEEKHAAEPEKVSEKTPPSAEPAKPALPQEKKPAGGFFGNLFGKKSAEQTPAEMKGIPLLPKPWPPEKKLSPEEEEHEKEAMAESLLEELNLPVHVKERGEELTRQRVKSFIAEKNRYPTENEYDEIAENVYEQLKSEYVKPKTPAETERKITESALGPQPAEQPLNKREQRRLEREKHRGISQQQAATRAPPQLRATVPPRAERRRRKPGEEAEEEFPISETPASEEQPTPAELFGDEEKGNEEITETEEAAESEGKKEAEELFGEEEKGEAEEEAPATEELEQKERCPTCHRQTEKLVYCPNCGNAFCESCTKQRIVLLDKIKYQCPKCKAEFKTKL